MKKLGILVFAAALVTGLVVANLFSFGPSAPRLFNFSFKMGRVQGSGNTTVDRRAISGFHGVEVSGIFQVDITAQKEYSVEVEADDNLMQYIRTEVDGGVLKISSDKRFSSSNPIRLRISAPDIDKLDATGVANVNLVDIKNGGLSIDSSGASKIKVSGETSKFVAEISGATKVDGDSLTAGNATVEANGASCVTLNVTGNLRADASGASRISYGGSPTEVVKKTSGASSVSAK